jgi:serine-type D-Ala-D-Ala carboxypeptidase (penicillin-binding protein 5/6)
MTKRWFMASREAGTIEGTSMGLYPNDELSVQDLLYGLMLPSGNDAALCLA